MINKTKLKEAIVEYKKYFKDHFKDEKYKWQALKHFDDNFNIDAQDFGEMFEISTEKTHNLLTSHMNYPRGMIKEFSKLNDEVTRKMFIDLYDESRDLKERIEEFK